MKRFRVKVRNPDTGEIIENEQYAPDFIGLAVRLANGGWEILTIEILSADLQGK